MSSGEMNTVIFEQFHQYILETEDRSRLIVEGHDSGLWTSGSETLQELSCSESGSPPKVIDRISMFVDPDFSHRLFESDSEYYFKLKIPQSGE